MSELTPCNYCTLWSIRDRNKGKKVELKPNEEHGGLDIYIDGEKRGGWFMEITDHCCC